MTTGAIPPELASSLMSDPAVQQAIKDQVLKSGHTAVQVLQDPAVQAQLRQVCQERFPEYAGVARDRLLELAKDPEVQRRAKECGALALQYAGRAGELFVNQIEQGPAGVRVLAFIGGTSSCVVSVMHLLNPFGLLGNTVVYVLSLYQLLFSVTTLLFEAKPEWIQRLGGGLNDYQDVLITKCKFISEALGRGLFYIFQGSLWLSTAGLLDLRRWLLGAYMVFIGVLNVLTHYGGYSRFAEKLSKTYRGGAGS